MLQLHSSGSHFCPSRFDENLLYTDADELVAPVAAASTSCKA